MSEEHRQLAELAKRVESVFDTDAVRDRLNHILDALLKATQGEVGRVARESLLLYRGQISQNRDEQWARLMAGIWTQNEDAEVPTNPHELQAWILAKQAARERELSKAALKEGYVTGFKTAHAEGIKLGWGTATVGKPLEEALSAGSKVVP